MILRPFTRPFTAPIEATGRSQNIDNINVVVAHPMGLTFHGVAVSDDLVVPQTPTQSSPIPEGMLLKSRLSDYRTLIGYDFNLASLKGIIKNPDLTAKLKPVLISFFGIPPDDSKTKAVNHILDHYVDKVMPPFAAVSGRVGGKVTKAEGIEYHELVATGFRSMRSLCINEVTEDSSSAFGILSAFKQGIVDERRLPLFDISVPQTSQGFQNKRLNEHLIHIYQYLCKQDSIPKRDQKSEEDVKKLSEKDQEYARKLKKLLPEGIALAIIWDISLNKTVLHFLTALRGHLYNCHPWLFIDLQRDLDKLHLPPEMESAAVEGDHKIRDGALLMKWRPRLHYLLRSCRLGDSKEEKRRRVCTIFAKHDGTFNGDLQEKMDELERKVQATARHIGVASLLEEKIETINLGSMCHNQMDDCSLRLNQKLEHVICETGYEVVPIAWIFLRSLFYRNKKSYIGKKELWAMAEECGMDEDSLKRFCKFYTSFGSIFDLSLVDTSYQYVIVKPMCFLQALDSLLYPCEEIHEAHPMVSYGIYSEKVCRKVFGDDWPAFMDALVSLCLATRIIASYIEAPPGITIRRNTVYYFISLSRTGSLKTTPDMHSIHLITSINTPHVFRQVSITQKLLETLESPKLIPCKNFNQTVIKDTHTGTTITIVSHSPATKLHLDKPNSEVCGYIVKAYNEIAKTCDVIVKYKFVKLCAACDISTVQSLPSSLYHILPDEDLCVRCKEANNQEDTELLQAWNEALKKVR